MSNNKIAAALKIYSIINAIVVIFASIILGVESENPVIVILGVALGICVNFAIYAGGELIDLLAQIRDNTKPLSAENTASLEDQLPDL